jgi:hypothetical protein
VASWRKWLVLSILLFSQRQLFADPAVVIANPADAKTGKLIETTIGWQFGAYYNVTVSKLGGIVTIDGGRFGKPVTQVDMMNAKFTDSGLVHLKGLIKLQSLDLGNSKASIEGLTKLKQALPNCT